MALIKYHLGTTAWGLKEWKGDFFTDDAKPDRFLKQYSSVFNSVEGNTTFYGYPEPETIKDWNRQADKNFKFCFKFPQIITHHKQLRDTKDDVTKFLELMEPLRNKLGPFLIQFPASFGPSNLELLDNFLSSLSVDFRYGVEVRHPNFFNHGPHERNLNDLLKGLGMNRIIFDTRKLHESKSEETTIQEAKRKKPNVPVRFDAVGSQPIVRYVGVNDVLNNEVYLKEWAIIVAEWIGEGKHPYFFAHAPNSYHGPWIARRFHELLRQFIEIDSLQKWPADSQDEQLGLF